MSKDEPSVPQTSGVARAAAQVTGEGSPRRGVLQRQGGALSRRGGAARAAGAGGEGGMGGGGRGEGGRFVIYREAEAAQWWASSNRACVVVRPQIMCGGICE